MNTDQVFDLLDSITYKPGWTLSAERNPDGLPLVRLNVEIETVNSDQHMALVGYPESRTLVHDVIIPANEVMDEEQIYSAILALLLDIEVHEGREFFRVGADQRAPFHPHRREGVDLWERTLAG